jgi:undecaprenyl-diphosphatase
MQLDSFLAQDKQLSQRLADWANGRFRHSLAWVLARTGDGIFWIFVILFLLWQQEPLGWELSIVAAATAVCVAILKGIFRRQRPRAKKALGTDKYSFPSGHAARATAVAFTLAFYNPILAPLWLIWAILVSLARVALSRHFLSDIVGGVVVGIIAGVGYQLLA